MDTEPIERFRRELAETEDALSGAGQNGRVQRHPSLKEKNIGWRCAQKSCKAV